MLAVPVAVPGMHSGRVSLGATVQSMPEPVAEESSQLEPLTEEPSKEPPAEESSQLEPVVLVSLKMPLVAL